MSQKTSMPGDLYASESRLSDRLIRIDLVIAIDEYSKFAVSNEGVEVVVLLTEARKSKLTTATDYRPLDWVTLWKT